MKSYYRVLRGSLVDFSWKSIWKVSAPLRMAFFFGSSSLLVCGFRKGFDNW